MSNFMICIDASHGRTTHFFPDEQSAIRTAMQSSHDYPYQPIIIWKWHLEFNTKNRRKEVMEKCNADKTHQEPK
jgi:hypothetical protein